MRPRLQPYPRPDRNRELIIAFSLILAITLIYVLVVIKFRNIPSARGFFGHSIGILGFLLMLMTETLYSLRKRSRLARWGKLSSWLKFHIITGITGPYMVLLHTSWKFNGLAGVLLLFTIVIVASGFLGRYIYTAIPRTADGAEMEVVEVERLIEELETDILAVQAGEQINQRSLRANAMILKRLTRRRNALNRQMSSLVTARRLLGLWHTVHVPIGMLLFTTALFHIIAAIYYATLIR
jgi:hypothetical protein